MLRAMTNEDLAHKWVLSYLVSAQVDAFCEEG